MAGNTHEIRVTAPMSAKRLAESGGLVVTPRCWMIYPALRISVSDACSCEFLTWELDPTHISKSTAAVQEPNTEVRKYRLVSGA